jgi:lipopolysaccharide assembly protein A
MSKLRPRLIFSVGLLVLVFAFALQNSEVVEVRFLLWGFALPRSLLIFTLLAVGVAVGWFLRGAFRITRA